MGEQKFNEGEQKFNEDASGIQEKEVVGGDLAKFREYLKPLVDQAGDSKEREPETVAIEQLIELANKVKGEDRNLAFVAGGLALTMALASQNPSEVLGVGAVSLDDDQDPLSPEFRQGDKPFDGLIYIFTNNETMALFGGMVKNEIITSSVEKMNSPVRHNLKPSIYYEPGEWDKVKDKAMSELKDKLRLVGADRVKEMMGFVYKDVYSGHGDPADKTPLKKVSDAVEALQL